MQGWWGAPRGPPRRAVFLGSLHFPSRREPFAWQINDDSVFLKGRAELIISPITWSGLVEIYSYHLPRTLEILRVMKGPPPGSRRAPAEQPGAGAGRAPQHGGQRAGSAAVCRGSELPETRLAGPGTGGHPLPPPSWPAPSTLLMPRGAREEPFSWETDRGHP